MRKQQNSSYFSIGCSVFDIRYSHFPATQSELSVYPNPAREYIIVEYKVQEAELPAVVKVMDSKGSVVARLPVNDVEGQMLYETKGINSGLYCFTLVTRLNTMVSKKLNVLKWVFYARQEMVSCLV
jgi:hypothetical protein